MHTSGPWRLSSDKRTIIDSDGVASTICECPDNRVPTSERWISNARLIAAAPDLLAALENLMSAGAAGEMDRCVALAHARAAIAKATEAQS